MEMFLEHVLNPGHVISLRLNRFYPCSNGNIMPGEHYDIFEIDENSIEILIPVLVEIYIALLVIF